MNKFILKIDDLFYHEDEADGSLLIKDMEMANIFSEKQLKIYGFPENLIGMEIYREDSDKPIEIKNVELIKV